MEYKITCEKVKGKLLSMPSIAIDSKVKYYACSFVIHDSRLFTDPLIFPIGYIKK